MIRKNFTLLGNLVVFALLSLAGVASAQTFNGSNLNQNGNSAIPLTGTGGCTGAANFNCNVTGTVTTLQKVTINLTHTWAGDLEIYLQSPNGQRIALSTGNGGSGDNYTNTVFQDGAASITTGTAPFTGTFAPEGAVGGFCASIPAGTIGTLAAFTGGQTGNWQLRIEDSAGGDSGNMTSWSLQFAAPPPPVDPCVFTCPPSVTVNLDGGECSAFVDYNAPTFTGNCSVPVVTPGSITQNNNMNIVDDALSFFGNPVSHWRGYAAQGQNFTVNSLTMAAWSSGTVQVFIYSYTGNIGTGTLNTAQMTLLGSSAATPVVGNAGADITFPINFATPVVIPANTKIVVEQRKVAGGTFVMASN
ncbi:MAG: proprotein convertase P-domain-containing protein, partial [Bacteroidota bacterium]